MKCPQCEKEGKTSKVYVGASTTTCMSLSDAYFDENGIYHESIDPNSHFQEYSCSNGHHWEARVK